MPLVMGMALILVCENLHDRFASRLKRRAIHAGRVHGPSGATLAVQNDHAAIAGFAACIGERADFHDDVVGRLLRALAVEFHARADIAGDADANEEFACTGGADAANAVLRVGACANDRRIADTAPAFASGAAC